MMYGLGRGITGWMPFNWVEIAMCALFVALIVTLIVVAVKSGRRYSAGCRPLHGAPHEAPPQASNPAEQILKERLAKGEIDETAYESILKKIRE